MLAKLLLWVRRNTRRVVALAIAPGLLLLAIDANIAHFMGGRGSEDTFLNGMQSVPIAYGIAAAALTFVVVLPFLGRAVFAWAMRILGVAGVGVGLAGTWFHIVNAVELLEGNFSWANIQGTIPDAPPPFAPLAFAGIGALFVLLPSSRLMLRYKLGTVPSTRTAEAVPPADEQQKKVA